MAADDTAVLAASMTSARLPDEPLFDTRAIQELDAAHSCIRSPTTRRCATKAHA